MIINMNSAFALTKESKEGQEPEQMNRYTANVTEKAEETRGRGYLNTRRNPRRKRKDYLWVRICRYMKCCPETCVQTVPGGRQKTQGSVAMNPIM